MALAVDKQLFVVWPNGVVPFLVSKRWIRSLQIWGVAKGSSVSRVAKFKGDKNSECKLSNGWSRSYKVIKLLLSAGK